MNWLSGISGGGLLAPIGLSALALVPVIVLLYLLKLRRTEVIIASTMLWRKSLQDLTANAPFQKLKANLLMFLQILAVILIAVALARPFMRAPGLYGNNQCVIIDRSGSMRALEAGGTARLDLAKETALKMIDDLRSGDRLMIVAFAEKAEVLCELTDNRARLRDAVRAVQPADGRSNIGDVMAIARSLAPNNRELASVVPDLQLILLSDGRLSDLDKVGETGLPLKYVRVGEAVVNAGIVGFDVRRPEVGDGAPQAFVQVANFGATALSTTLTLRLDESDLAVETLEVEPDGTKELVFALPEISEGVLDATLDTQDALASDNRAAYVIRPGEHVDVLIVSEGESVTTQYLTRAFGLDPRVKLLTLAPKDYTGAERADLIVFNRFAPLTLPGRGGVAFLDALPKLDGLLESGVIDAPAILSTDRTHPVMRFLNPANVHIASARKLTLPEGARALLSTQEGALIADVSRGGDQIIVVAFDPASSDWPLNLSFPLFVQNLVNWTPRDAAMDAGQQATGAPIELMPMADMTIAKVVRPDGVEDAVQLDITRPVYYSSTEQVGVYTVTSGETSRKVAVNLLDARESDVRPPESIQVGRGVVAAEKGPIIVNKELWPWLAAAALAVLLGEWMLYCRRAGW
jgi:Ca-activated chloride channel family protein